MAPEHQAWEWAADPFAAKKEVEERQKRKKEKEAIKDGASTNGDGGSGRITSTSITSGAGGKPWDDVPEVKMAPVLREMVEGTVKKVMLSVFDDNVADSIR